MGIRKIYNADIVIFGYWVIATAVFAVLMWLVISIPDARNGLMYACIVILGPLVLMGLYGYGSYAIEYFLYWNEKRKLLQNVKEDSENYEEEEDSNLPKLYR